MTEYSGDKAFDAEMFIDLQTGELTMDYTLNTTADILDSNSGVTLKNEFREQPRKIIILENIRSMIIMLFSVIYLGITMPLLVRGFHKGWIKNKNYQIEHQKLLKYMFSNCRGTDFEIIDAPIKEHVLTVHLNNNMWISYKLEGDFETEIKTIALKRSFKKTMIYGKYERIRQNGWDLIFEFNKPPQTGKCIVEHL